MTIEKGLSIIIPAYNESERICSTLIQVQAYCNELKIIHQIVVVDDGSTDDTFKQLLNQKKYIKNLTILSEKENKGKGYAVRQGLIHSKYNACLILDADHSVEINELDKFFRLCQSYKIFQEKFIYGERKQVKKQPLYRIIAGKAFKIYVWLITGIFADSQCPFKILNMPKEFYDELSIDGFAYDVEIFLKLKARGITGESMQVNYYNDERSKVTLKKTIQMAKDIWQIRKIR